MAAGDIQRVPLDSSDKVSNFKFRTTLDEVDYFLRFRWNSRSALWLMDIYDADDQPINMSIRLVVNTNLIEKYKNDRMPKGILMLFDTEGSYEECGFDELGNRCVLIYEATV